MEFQTYLEKVYAGYLGKNIGVRLGAPVEPLSWTYERIQELFPEINGYVKPADAFAADDDINGPSFFFRALIDEGIEAFSAAAVGRAWLNYTRQQQGMFWWGGVGVSTEHTAYHNLKHGIAAPASGSIQQNGLAAAEQIGGQIFIDTWGLLVPGNPQKAAAYAGTAASVSHDGNGIYGAQFMAACISAAFEEGSISEIIQIGLSSIPEDSAYAKVVHAVVQYKNNHPNVDFRACRAFLNAEWGYDKYPGVCHIIPNAGICIIALLYGEGDFARTIEIATMCGWDTDCNAGNVATILAVRNGVAGLPAHYRDPIRDVTFTSSVSGYLNIIDIPTFAKEVAELGWRMLKEPPQERIPVSKGCLDFDFALPHAIHGFRTNTPNKLLIRNRKDAGISGNALEIVLDNLVVGDSCKLYYKPFYHREDLEDERYNPVFTPLVYSKQQVSATVKLDQWTGGQVYVVPYVASRSGEIRLNPVELTKSWQVIDFELPPVADALIDELGFFIETDSLFVDGNGALGRLLMDSFIVDGDSWYTIDFGKQREEFQSITPFSHHLGAHEIVDDHLYITAEEEASLSLTGNYYTKAVQLTTSITPLSGTTHQLVFRAPGICRFYSIGFSQEGIVLEKHDFGCTTLAAVSYDWQLNQRYVCQLKVAGQEVRFSINGIEVLVYDALDECYGMFGLYSQASTTKVGSMHIRSSV